MGSADPNDLAATSGVRWWNDYADGGRAYVLNLNTDAAIYANCLGVLASSHHHSRNHRPSSPRRMSHPTYCRLHRSWVRKSHPSQTPGRPARARTHPCDSLRSQSVNSMSSNSCAGCVPLLSAKSANCTTTRRLPLTLFDGTTTKSIPRAVAGRESASAPFKPAAGTVKPIASRC